MSHTQTLRLKSCTMEVEYDWDNAADNLDDITLITPIEGDTVLDILNQGITIEDIKADVIVNHVEPDRFEE